MSDPFLGEIKMVGFNFAPRGYSFCNGSTMAISQNSALFSLLGTTFGGDGVQTFGLPDYRGRLPVGMGNGPGLTPVVQGEKAGTTSVSILPTQMPSHNHTAALSIAIPVSTAAADTQAPGPTVVLAAAQFGTDRDVTLVSAYVSTAATTTLTPFNTSGTTGLSGGGQPLPIQNPYLGTNFIIAMEGIFPSRP
jgi:microcystin-dependent protein